MLLRILGSLEIRRDGHRVTPVRRRARVLLGLLCLRANVSTATDVLVDALWDGSPPASAAANLRSSVAELRRLLPGIESTAGGYVLHATSETLDVLAFTESADEGRKHLAAGAFQDAAAKLTAAADLWRGPVLDGLPVPEVARPEARWLEDRRLDVVEDAVEARLALGDETRLADELRLLTGRHGLRERLWRQLMLALYRCGRQAEATAAYQELHRLLDDELGVRPSPETQRLHQRLLSADPALDPARPVPVHRPLRQLPPDIAAFVGRTDQLAELDRPGGTVVISAVSGTAGVGKTALAVHWAHRAQTRFPDGCLYVDLRGYGPEPPLEPAEALTGFLRALGVADPPLDTAGLSARFRSELADRRVLLVLDNACSPNQVRPLLPASPHCRALVTSRDRLAGLVARDGAHRIDLDLLPDGDAHDLLGRLIGARAAAEPSAVARLADLCARLPLALRIAAELAVARRDVSLSALADELAHRRLDLLDADGDDHTAVRAVFSWSLAALPVAVGRAFAVLGLHPGRDFDPYAAAALLDTDLAGATAPLDHLARAHLVHQVGPGRYGMHDLLRDYAVELASSERAVVVPRLLGHYRATAAEAMDLLYPHERERRPAVPVVATSPRLSEANAQAWLDAERANLVAVAVHAAEHGWGEHTGDLSAILWRDFTSGAYYAEALTLHGHAQRTAHERGDEAGEANAHNLLGIIRYRLGDYGAALRHYDLARDLRVRVGDRPGVANTLTNIGVVLWQTGDLPRALEHLQKALALHRELGQRGVEGSTLGNIGVVHWYLGRFDQAIEYNRQALEIHREVGDRVGAAMNLNNLAAAFRRLGRYAEAEEHSVRELELAREHGNRDSEAAALTGLGVLAGPDAERRLVAALEIYREAGSAAGEGEVLTALGRLRGDVGLLRRALEITRGLGALPLEATASIDLAGVLLARGERAESLALARSAFDLAERAGDRYEQARALEAAARALGSRESDSWAEAVRRYTEMGVPVPVW